MQWIQNSNSKITNSRITCVVYTDEPCTHSQLQWPAWLDTAECHQRAASTTTPLQYNAVSLACTYPELFSACSQMFRHWNHTQQHSADLQ